MFHQQSRERQRAVKQQKLVAEAVSREVRRGVIDGEAHQRGRQGDVRHGLVGGGALGEKAEGEQSEERPVGVRAKDVNGVDYASRVD